MNPLNFIIWTSIILLIILLSIPVIYLYARIISLAIIRSLSIHLNFLKIYKLLRRFSHETTEHEKTIKEKNG